MESSNQAIKESPQKLKVLPCDICGKMPKDRWYKCLKCVVYNICNSCYDLKRANLSHTPEHPMQCLITSGYFGLYYGGEDLQPRKMQSFTCPACGKMGFTVESLYTHLLTEHRENTFKLSCPLCLAEPDILVKKPPELIAHLDLKHF